MTKAFLTKVLQGNIDQTCCLVKYVVRLSCYYNRV